MQKINDKLVCYASIVEDHTLDRAKTVADMPFIYPHIALMPDAHTGHGPPVGSVIPTLDVVMPYAVGVDIGCGMIGVRTLFTKHDITNVVQNENFGRTLKTLREQIERAVPCGKGQNNKKIQPSAAERIAQLEKLAEDSGFNPDVYHSEWRAQLGTLGGGNHFIEVCLDETDRVWLFLHSGSRGVGNKIATHHIAKAVEQCKQNGVVFPRKPAKEGKLGKEDTDLAWLTAGTPEFERYIKELHWAQEYARHNRDEMMDRVVRQFSYWMGRPIPVERTTDDPPDLPEFLVEPAQVIEEMRINTHHNYAVQEVHFGKAVWITRKGAVDATEGKWGLIPGSMGTRSYVVRGKGNETALCSAPHGAGRRMGREEAKRRFKQEDLREAMQGIEFRDSPTLIDEIPASYKDIDQVMADACDLVETVHILRQIVNVKGD